METQNETFHKENYEIFLKNKNPDEESDILTQSVGKNVRIVWYFTNNLIDEDTSTNPIGMMRPGIDIIALPNCPEILNVWKWSQKVFKYEDSQVIFYEPFKNQEEEKKTIKGIISYLNQIKDGLVNKFFPFFTNRVLNEVSQSEGLEVLNDNIWDLPDKSWLHKNVPGSTSKSPEEIFNLKLPQGINVPKGYVIHSFEELHKAKAILEQEGAKKFILKNVVGYSGGYIWPVRNEQEFQVAMKEMSFTEKIYGYSRPPAFIIEELLEASVGEKDTCYTPIVHYIGQNILPGVYYQYCPVFSYSGMNSNVAPEEISKECIRQAEILNSSLKFKGPWGIDFVTDETNKAYVIDINCGRICGSHYFRICVDLFAKGQVFDSWTHPTNPEINSFYEQMDSHGISYDFVKKRGIIPLRVIYPKKLSLLCIGDNFEQVKKIKKIFLEKFSTN
jgi:hypothetical protein